MNINRDKDLVTLTCEDCGTSFTLTFGRYRRCPSSTHWRCKRCQNIQRSIRFANLTEAQRDQLHQQRSKSARKSWKELTADEYLRRCISQRARWSKLSKSEKDAIMASTRSAQLKYANDPETKKKLAARNHERWINMTDQERQLEIERLNKIRDEYWCSLSTDEKLIKMMKMWSANGISIGPTEYLFNDRLHQIGLQNGYEYYWSYNTYPYIHPEFWNVFDKINPITHEENIPYHSWDFILFPNTNNPLLVDIDGSAHNPSCMHFKRYGNDYTERAKIDYNDSKRLYQIPDRMTAYVIISWDDTLSDTTKVINLQEKTVISFPALLQIIDDRYQGLSSSTVVKSSSTIEPLR